MKSLSPQERDELARKRLVFRKLHDAFAPDSLIQAEGGIGEAIGIIENLFMNLQGVVKIKELETNGLVNSGGKEIMDIVANETITDAVTFLRALHTAIQQHKNIKFKDVIIKDLDIKLL